MIKAALQYFKEQCKPEIVEIGDAIYSDKSLYEINPIPYAEAITLRTLSSLVDYLKAGADVMRGTMFVHIVNPTKIKVFSTLDEKRNRETVVEVQAMLPDIDTNCFVNREKFNIALQSKFVDNADKALLLKFVGTVESGTVQEYGDDGVSQKATIKTGIATKGDAVVPNPVRLKPFRTFTEVEQPESAFVFRMENDKYGGIDCAIFEADGGAWKKEAMDNVKAYLQEALAEVKDVIIIS